MYFNLKASEFQMDSRINANFERLKFEQERVRLLNSGK